MKNHKEFLKEASDANSLPSQTCRAMSPEIPKDIAIYLEDKE